MAFTYDLSTDRGALRFRLGDTNPLAYVFEDAEVDYLLTLGGSVASGVKEGIKVLISSKAHRIKRASSLGLSIDDTAQVSELRAWLNDLGGALPSASVTFPRRLPGDAGYDPTTRS